jgi:SAM-dependent methyltransferase
MSAEPIDLHSYFPPGFFSRSDESNDANFYAFDRLVTHIDDRAIAAVGALYSELGLNGCVLDIMSSWISHFDVAPRELVVLGMNENELAHNSAAHERVVHDLNVIPTLPFNDGRFDAVTCCVSVDYLTRPIDVLREAARVTKPGGVVVCTFSNRCFPTKAIRGWLGTDETARVSTVAKFYELTNQYVNIQTALRTPLHSAGDPLYAVWATVG